MPNAIEATENLIMGLEKDPSTLCEEIKRLLMNHDIFNLVFLQMRSKYIEKPWALVVFLLSSISMFSQPVVVGAERSDQYLDHFRGKKVGVVVNHTSRVGEVHLVNFLLEKQVDISVVFAPEHGFRGKKADGETIVDGKDLETGLPLISLYGKNKKPKPEQLKDLDFLVFDIQDVGTRFYTFTSTMTLCMEACAESGIPMWIFDRPNPNGHYFDGPVLESDFKSFVGMHPVPIVHGLTIGEYARMIVGENWINKASSLQLNIVPCLDYTHQIRYELPVAPSPNLPTVESIILYPSLCLFEGTEVSIGRGTSTPFQVIGAPWFLEGEISFTPQSMESSKNPKHKGEKCFGFDLRDFSLSYLNTSNELYLYWLMGFYEMAPDKEKFFTSYFDKLAGNDKLRKQIRDGKTVEEIRSSWKVELAQYSSLRDQYLMYPK